MADKKVYNTMADLSEKTAIVFKYMLANDFAQTGAEIATGAELSEAGIHGLLNILVKIGWAEKGEKVERPFTSKDGKTSGVKEYVTYVLTDAGRSVGAQG